MKLPFAAVLIGITVFAGAPAANAPRVPVLLELFTSEVMFKLLPPADKEFSKPWINNPSPTRI